MRMAAAMYRNNVTIYCPTAAFVVFVHSTLVSGNSYHSNSSASMTVCVRGGNDSLSFKAVITFLHLKKTRELLKKIYTSYNVCLFSVTVCLTRTPCMPTVAVDCCQNAGKDIHQNGTTLVTCQKESHKNSISLCVVFVQVPAIDRTTHTKHSFGPSSAQIHAHSLTCQ